MLYFFICLHSDTSNNMPESKLIHPGQLEAHFFGQI